MIIMSSFGEPDCCYYWAVCMSQSVCGKHEWYTSRDKNRHGVITCNKANNMRQLPSIIPFMLFIAENGGLQEV